MKSAILKRSLDLPFIDHLFSLITDGYADLRNRTVDRKAGSIFTALFAEIIYIG